MIAQDSGDPTGIRAPARHSSHDPNHASRPRSRKASAALALALGGMGWDDIAASIGYPTGRTARVAAEKALERELANPQDRDKMRRMAGLRLERLLRSCWPKALNPDHPEHLTALTKAREIIAQHAKLYGLDAPTEVVVHNPTMAEIEAFVARLATPVPVVEFDIISGTVVEEHDDAVPELG